MWLEDLWWYCTRHRINHYRVRLSYNTNVVWILRERHGLVTAYTVELGAKLRSKSLSASCATYSPHTVSPSAMSSVCSVADGLLPWTPATCAVNAAPH